jgi:hypothetical protein
MADRAEIARRHGIGHLADKLVGETGAELEADAAARASIIRLFSPHDPEAPPPPEPPVAGLPDKSKPAAEYTEAEWAATRENTLRILRDRDREREEQQRREDAERNRTPEQQTADSISASLQPGAKQARNVELLRSLGLLGGEEE